MLAPIEERARALDRSVDHRDEVDPLALELEHAPTDAGDVEQVVDEPHHVIELPVHRGERARRRRLAVRLPRDQHVEPGAERRERVAQLVREDREELVLLLPRRSERGLRLLELRRPFAHALLEALVQLRERARLAEEICEHLDFVAEDLRVRGLREVVDRACAVARDDVLIVHVVRGQEEDRHLPEFLGALDRLRELEPAHPGHLDVEDDRRHVVLEEQLQRTIRRLRAEQAVRGILEDALEGVEVPRFVVDEEDVDGIVHRWSHTRSRESSWSVLTGLAM
ncbi:MAG: hypothetical protein U0414_34025 [Polyangiaceae bacterium]